MPYNSDQQGYPYLIIDDNAGPQTQAFGFDELYRLTSAEATGGSNGLYSEEYSYDEDTGNLAEKAGISYGYNDNSHAHAVTHLDSTQKYWYDDNGNMTTKVVGADTYAFTFDGENKLVLAQINSTTIGTYTYDGDGNRVKVVTGAVTTAYIGNYYEWNGETGTKYYYAGAQRVSMRVGTVDEVYLFSDHLSSTSVTASNTGTLIAEMRYKAWGETRYASGNTPTTYRYTGQRENAEIGLYFYGARWYDPTLSRWVQPDSIIPDTLNPKSFDHYTYVNNNPILYLDPSGHMIQVEDNLFVREDKKSGDIIIVNSGDYFNNNWVEQDIANAVLNNDPKYLANLPENQPGFMIGAAYEGACEKIGIDAGNYYRTFITLITAALSGVPGAKYPGYITNSTPNNIRYDAIGSPDCPGCGYQLITNDGLRNSANNTLNSIKQGGPYPHKEDGSVFRNDEGLLPLSKLPDYYREYTIPIPGQTNRGISRYVIGSNAEIYLTLDHYKSFTRLH